MSESPHHASFTCEVRSRASFKNWAKSLPELNQENCPLQSDWTKRQMIEIPPRCWWKKKPTSTLVKFFVFWKWVRWAKGAFLRLGNGVTVCSRSERRIWEYPQRMEGAGLCVQFCNGYSGSALRSTLLNLHQESPQMPPASKWGQQRSKVIYLFHPCFLQWRQLPRFFVERYQ